MEKFELKNLITDISPKDDMYLANKENYFDVGESALRLIQEVFGSNVDRVETILDMPCGFGRVLRYLRAFWPNAKIVASDLNWDAVSFCHETFDAIISYSNIDIQGLEFPYKFDLIWVGSLFTHFDKVRCDNLLQILIDYLNEDGILVFTTHGRIAAYLADIREPSFALSEDQYVRLLSDYHKSDFGYVNYDDEHPYYGFSLSKPSFVVKKIEKIKKVKIHGLKEQGWGYQDVFAVKLMNMGAE
jgi:SAM-dependent methyltransferase